MSSTDSSSGDQAPMLIAVEFCLLGLAILSTAVRVYTRLRITRTFDTDDILIVCALLATMALGAYVVIATKYGLGKHLSDQQPGQLEPFQKTMVVAALIYCIANTLVKLSLLALYGRLSNDRTFRTYVHIVVFICVGAGVANFVIVGYLYNLLTMLWDSVPRASGINILSFYFFGISIHIVTEFILFALPIPTLLKLDMPRRQKVGIIVLFCLGAFLIGSSIYRLTLLGNLATSLDITWNISLPIVGYTSEINISILIANAAGILDFGRRYYPKIFGHPPLNNIPKSLETIEEVDEEDLSPHTPLPTSIFPLKSLRSLTPLTGDKRGPTSMLSRVMDKIGSRKSSLVLDEWNDSEERIISSYTNDNRISTRSDVWVDEMWDDVELESEAKKYELDANGNRKGSAGSKSMYSDNNDGPRKDSAGSKSHYTDKDPGRRIDKWF